MPAPLTPSSEEARDWATQELSRSVYSTEPSLWERIWDWIWDVIDKILSQGEGLDNIVMPVVLFSAIAAIIFIAIAFGRNVRRTSETTSPADAAMWDENDERPADSIRVAAHEAARAADFSLAVVEAYRALVRSVEERDIAATGAGMTALEAAGVVARPFPTHRDQLFSAAQLFNAGLYGTERLSRSDFESVVALDQSLLSTPAASEVIA